MTWDKLFLSRSNGCNNCNFFPFKIKMGWPFGNTKSNTISVNGSPIIGNSSGIVTWLTSEKKELFKKKLHWIWKQCLDICVIQILGN